MNRTSVRYSIVVEGQLDPGWSEWLEGLTMDYATATGTTLEGCLTDQSVLLGVLKKLHALGLQLVSVQRLAAGANVATEQPTEEAVQMKGEPQQ